MPIATRVPNPVTLAGLLRLSRRAASPLAIVAALLVTTLTGGPAARAAGIYDNMEYLAKHLPPGILHVRDRAIRILYAQEISDLWYDFGRVSYRMASEFNGYYDDVIVKPWSYKIEPAFHLFRHQLDFKGYRLGRTGKSTFAPPPLDDIPQMHAFAEGIRYFYSAYVYGHGSERTKRATESRFIHSIAYAAYDNEATAERKAKEYLNAGLDGKKRVVHGHEGAVRGDGERRPQFHRIPGTRITASL